MQNGLAGIQKCKLRNMNHFARWVQQNATDACRLSVRRFESPVVKIIKVSFKSLLMDTVVLFIKWFLKSISGPLSRFSRAILGKGFLENLDIPLRRAALPHAIVNENAGSRSPKRSPTVMLPHAIVTKMSNCNVATCNCKRKSREP